MVLARSSSWAFHWGTGAVYYPLAIPFILKSLQNFQEPTVSVRGSQTQAAQSRKAMWVRINLHWARMLWALWACLVLFVPTFVVSYCVYPKPGCLFLSVVTDLKSKVHPWLSSWSRRRAITPEQVMCVNLPACQTSTGPDAFISSISSPCFSFILASKQLCQMLHRNCPCALFYWFLLNIFYSSKEAQKVILGEIQQKQQLNWDNFSGCLWPMCSFGCGSARQRITLQPETCEILMSSHLGWECSIKLHFKAGDLASPCPMYTECLLESIYETEML